MESELSDQSSSFPCHCISSKTIPPFFFCFFVICSCRSTDKCFLFLRGTPSSVTAETKNKKLKETWKEQHFQLGHIATQTRQHFLFSSFSKCNQIRGLYFPWEQKRVRIPSRWRVTCSVFRRWISRASFTQMRLIEWDLKRREAAIGRAMRVCSSVSSYCVEFCSGVAWMCAWAH